MPNTGAKRQREEQEKPPAKQQAPADAETKKPLDIVEEASIESFPASDPPPWTSGEPRISSPRSKASASSGSAPRSKDKGPKSRQRRPAPK